MESNTHDDNVDYVLVERVMALYDPWEAMRLEPVAREELPDHFQGYEHPHIRGPNYDLGRIATILREGRLDPIELDNRWVGSIPMSLILVDGHHRLVAASLAGVQLIPSYYSGLVRALEWLQGDGDIEDPPFG